MERRQQHQDPSMLPEPCAMRLDDGEGTPGCLAGQLKKVRMASRGTAMLSGSSQWMNSRRHCRHCGPTWNIPAAA